jgi:hypothetical protein
VPIKLHDQNEGPVTPDPAATAEGDLSGALTTSAEVTVAATASTAQVPRGVTALFPDLTLVGPPIFCPSPSRVLLLPANGGSLPPTWSALAVEAQAQDPIVLDFNQLAAIANSPKSSSFSKCIAPWGVSTSNIRQVFQRWTYSGRGSINNAYVFSAGRTIFVTLR